MKIKRLGFFLFILNIFLLISCNFVFSNKLSQPSIYESEGIISWDEIDNSSGYLLSINEEEVEIDALTYNTYFLSDGVYIFKVKAIASKGYVDSDYSSELLYEKKTIEKLPSPSIFLDDTTIKWKKIDNALKYNVYVDGEFFKETTSTSISILEIGTYEFVQVKAISNNSDFQDSDLSKKLVFKVSDKENFEVNLFMINDTHGSFVDSSTPGVQRVSSAIKKLENDGAEFIKIANGDIFQGSYVSSSLRGRPLVDALNEMKFDAFIIGNHEFDWGLDEIKKYNDGSLENGEANFPFVCANIYSKSTNQPLDWLEPYTIVEKGDAKVGIIGLIGTGLESSILSLHVKDYEFVYPVEIVKKLASELREKGVNSVVVAIHDYDKELNQKLGELDGDSKIDAILCAHTHQNINTTVTRSDGKKIPVVQNRDKNRTASALILSYEDGNFKNYQYQQFELNSFMPDDDLEGLINNYKDIIANGNKIIGVSYGEISKSTIGREVTTEMAKHFNCDVGIINTGGVRASLGAGNISVANVFEIFPFENAILKITMTGDKLKSLYNSNGGYLYFNESFDVNKLIDSKEYSVVVIDFVFTGVYYTEFTGLEYEQTKVLLRDIAIEYFDKNY